MTSSSSASSAGSVALWFCQIGAPRLVEQMKRHAFFSGKEIVPLCFSHEGYKQPQEAVVLAYFLSIGQPFDLVVNIDGFNDVALGSLNNERGLDFSMPSVQHLDPLINVVNQSTLTPDKLETLAGIFRDRRTLLDLTDRIRANRIASVNFVLDRYYRMVSNRYVEGLGRFSNLPSNPPDNAFVQVAPSLEGRAPAALHAGIASTWRDASVLMKDMLAERQRELLPFPAAESVLPDEDVQRRGSGDCAERRVAVQEECGSRVRGDGCGRFNAGAAQCSVLRRHARLRSRAGPHVHGRLLPLHAGRKLRPRGFHRRVDPQGARTVAALRMVRLKPDRPSRLTGTP